MERSTEKSVSSVASGNSINSKLRYPLRSALRSKEGKPPVPDFSGSSAPRRGRVASAVSQSTTVLDLSAKKSVDRTKPPRRMSIPNKTSSNSSVKSVSSSVTSLSETKAKRPGGYARSLNETPASSVMRSGIRRRVEDLSSSAYWLTHIKLAESVGKHSISLGFFKLALHAGCEPLNKMKEELKSYAARNNLDGLDDAMKELSELYNISEESKQTQKVSETTSEVAEEATDNDVQSSLSTPVDSKITSEIIKEDVSQDSAVIKVDKEEVVSESIPQGRTRRSLDVINVNQADVPEAAQGPEDGVPMVTVVQPSEKKRASKKETVSKNSLPVRKSVATKTNSVNPRAVSENKDNKSLKKPERVTKPRTKKVQEETKKSTKKPAAKEGEEVKSLKQMNKMENKENSVVVGAGEEIQV